MRYVLDKACDLLGNQAELAKRLGVTPQAVNNWYRNGVPATRAMQIENLTGGKVSAKELCPDFPWSGKAA